jgi:hypothetical protein
MECWNNGTLGQSALGEETVSLIHHSIIPFFHSSCVSWLVDFFTKVGIIVGKGCSATAEDLRLN